MDLLLLPGNSPNNKIWIEEVEKQLKDLFATTKIQYYAHWKNNQTINLEQEITLLSTADTLKEYVVFAKSIGTYLTLVAYSKQKIHPKRIIFLGFPLKFFFAQGSSKEVEIMLNTLQVPVLFLQNSHDPFCSYQELVAFLSTTILKNYRTYEFSNTSTHEYLEYKKIKELVSTFLE